MKKIIFLGGVFPDSQRNFIVSNSKGVIQNAADVFQSNLIRGLEEATDSCISVVNLPFVGAYPFRFRCSYFPSIYDVIGLKSRIHGFCFLNIIFIKHLSRLITALWGLFFVGRGETTYLIVYSAHLPFVVAALLYRKFKSGVSICIIVPDLPEYMGGNGLLYLFIKKIETFVFYLLAPLFDFFVVLTDDMIDRLKIPRSNSVVVEGVAVVSPESTQPLKTEHNRRHKIFLYSGTLAKRYGILELLDAFQFPELSDHELWICGDGDGKLNVENVAQKNKNIKYLGQLPHNQVLSLHSKATVLVNPRAPDEEYTKFSFPSKTLEYMISGRPVVMYSLPGIPLEYEGLYISPEGLGVNALAACFIKLVHMNDSDLNLIGEKAMNFVIAEKSPLKQAQKIIGLFTRDF